MGWLSILNPLNWPQDLSNSFNSQLEGGMIYILALFLNTFLGITNSIMAQTMSIFESIVNFFIDVALAGGPFALPIFSIGMAAVMGAAYLVFGALKDMPVVGAFV